MTSDRDASELIDMLVAAGSGTLRIAGPLHLPVLPEGSAYEISVIRLGMMIPDGGYEAVPFPSFTPE